VGRNTRREGSTEVCISIRKTGRKINADINAAVNIARRPGHRIIITRKIESYLVNA
jgi:transposase